MEERRWWWNDDIWSKWYVNLYFSGRIYTYRILYYQNIYRNESYAFQTVRNCTYFAFDFNKSTQKANIHFPNIYWDSRLILPVNESLQTLLKRVSEMKKKKCASILFSFNLFMADCIVEYIEFLSAFAAQCRKISVDVLFSHWMCSKMR